MRITLLVVVLGLFLTAPAASSWASTRESAHKRAHISANASCPRRHRRCMNVVVTPFRPWLRGLRGCESHDTNVDSTFDGYYQFSPSTWSRVDDGYAYQHSRMRQSFGVVRWLRIIGWSNRATTAGWPNCSPW